MSRKTFRFEFKYYTKNLVAHEIEKYLKKYLIPDKHATAKDGSYTVTSLYFDSYKLTDYWEKTGGHIRRKKIRLRIYEDYLKNSQFVSFEIKHKEDMMNGKTKIHLSKNEANDLIKNGVKFFITHKWSKESQNEKNRILYYFMKENVKPKVFVTYKRKAFMNNDKNLRVTLDYNLNTSWQNNLDKPKFLTPVHKNATIIEIKYQYILPFWLNTLSKKFNLKRDTFSKYEKSLEELNKYNPLLR